MNEDNYKKVASAVSPLCFQLVNLVRGGPYLVKEGSVRLLIHLFKFIGGFDRTLYSEVLILL